MKRLPVVFKRQLACFLSQPSIWFGTALFVVVSTAAGFQHGLLLETGRNDLQAFFRFHPWTYLLLVPVLCTQLWTDEHCNGGRDFFKSLPFSPCELVIGKFLAAWAIVAIALLLTFPLLISANYLGAPDNNMIGLQYLASGLLAGSYLAVGCFICVVFDQRMVIFTLTSSLLLAASSLSSVLDALDHQASIWVVDSVIALNPSIRFEAMEQGLLTLNDSLFFISMILAFLTATVVTLNYKNG